MNSTQTLFARSGTLLASVGTLAAAGTLAPNPAVAIGTAIVGTIIGVAVPFIGRKEDKPAADAESRIPRVSAAMAATLYVAGKYQIDQERLRQILHGELPDVQYNEIKADYESVLAQYQAKIDRIRQGAVA